MNTNIGIKSKDSQVIADELAKILADEYLLLTKTHNAHWNVEGSGFQALHSFFDEQSKQLEGFVDQVAERIRSIGHYAPGSLKSFLELTRLTEASMETNDRTGFITELLADHEIVILKLRECVHALATKDHDAGTMGFLTDLMEKHEKMAWLLRAHL